MQEDSPSWLPSETLYPQYHQECIEIFTFCCVFNTHETPVCKQFCTERMNIIDSDTRFKDVLECGKKKEKQLCTKNKELLEGFDRTGLYY